MSVPAEEWTVSVVDKVEGDPSFGPESREAMVDLKHNHELVFQGLDGQAVVRADSPARSVVGQDIDNAALTTAGDEHLTSKEESEGDEGEIEINGMRPASMTNEVTMTEVEGGIDEDRQEELVAEQAVASEEDDEESQSSEDDDGAESTAEEEAETSEDDGPVEDSEKCVFCNQHLEEDGSELNPACMVCRRPAHLTCLFKSESVQLGSQSTWRCQACSRKQNSESPKENSTKQRHSAPRLVRDLLPVSRGVQKPGSHSIFAQPLISEGEDGGRALRKRKSPTTEPVSRPEKRRRRTTATTRATSATPSIRENKLEAENTILHSTRRISQRPVPSARILQHRPFEKAPPHKFILAFRLDQNRIEAILSHPPRPGRRRERKKQQKLLAPPLYQPPVSKFPALPTNNLIFPSMFTDRENEINSKPYGGILAEDEADTSRSLPQLRDREIFEIARKEAEEERRKTSAKAEEEINGENNPNAAKPNRIVSGPPSKIKCIQFGKFVIDTFYAAPYPEEYSHESRLFICEFCLKYLPSEFVAYRHKLKCPAKHPPGDEIYRDGSISIWEVDGRKKTEYCQCLCLMAKMFLGSKTLYYDVEPFLFYILTEYDDLGYHFVGYFSKEKRPASQNNVSCILVMPIHQRKGYATFLIDFSYLLTRIEGKDGSPEKPLSDMGLTAYRSYWDLIISTHLLDLDMTPFSVKDLMTRTGMTADDVVHSLERLYAFVKDPVTKVYAIRYDKKLYEGIVREYESKNHRKLRPEMLVWTPYIMGRSDQANLDGQPMHTVAQREGDELEYGETDPQSADTKSRTIADEIGDGDQVSPKTHQAASSVPPETDTQPPVNGHGMVAPGPPPTDALNAVPISTYEASALNGHTEPDSKVPSETGYALAYRLHNIPPSRFQIDPPIPPSMLRGRSVKKRNPGRPRLNGRTGVSPVTPAAVRSSPRHASRTNSVNGAASPGGSPEKPSTPNRRSGRKSRLATELVALDGVVDEQMGAEDDSEDGEAVNPKSVVDPEEEDEGSTEESEDDSQEEEESVAEESDNSSDPDVEIADEEEDEEEEDDDEVEVEAEAVSVMDDEEDSDEEEE